MPLPTVARSDPGYRATDYWRGSAWVNINALTVSGLLKYAQKFADVGDTKTSKEFFETASEITSKTQAATAQGFYEYYASDQTGRRNFAQGPKDFTWSGLSVSMGADLHLARQRLAESGVNTDSK